MARRLLIGLCVLLVAAGVALRLHDLGTPRDFMFDEKWFVGGARRYLAHQSDQNDHPPLGKLVIALSLATFGDNPVAWRVPSALAGVANVALAGLLGRALFRDRLAGLLAATFVAADGFLISLSRSAVMDQQLAFLFLATALALVGGTGSVMCAAVLAGLAAAVKFSGVMLVLPLLVRLLLDDGPLARRLPMLLLTPLTYGLVFAGGLALAGRPCAPYDVVVQSTRLLGLQASLNNWTNPWVSHWYAWFLPTRPLTIDYALVGEQGVRSTTTLGNLALWWGADLALLMTVLAFVRGGAFITTYRRAAAWLLLLWGCPILPWVFSDRDSYLYHYLPAWPFALTLSAGWLAWLHRARPVLVLVLVAAVAGVFCLYAPLWAGLVVSEETRRALLFIPEWARPRH